MQLNWSSFTYRARERPDEGALCVRIRDIASVRVRYGYMRITALLKREGWQVGPKRVYRIYKEEDLEVRTRKRRKYASAVRVPLPEAGKPGVRWSMDFVADRLADGKRLRVLTVVDHFDRSCPVLSGTIGAGKVADALDRAAQEVGALPDAITVDKRPELPATYWTHVYNRGVKLEVYRLDYNTINTQPLAIYSEYRELHQQNHAPAQGPEPNTGNGLKKRSTSTRLIEKTPQIKGWLKHIDPHFCLHSGP